MSLELQAQLPLQVFLKQHLAQCLQSSNRMLTRQNIRQQSVYNYVLEALV